MRQGGKNRSRGRNNGRKPHMPMRIQTFDSAGPEVRIRGNAWQVHERYLSLARDAAAAGDRVAAENFFQHADHYYRMVNLNGDGRPHHQGQHPHHQGQPHPPFQGQHPQQQGQPQPPGQPPQMGQPAMGNQMAPPPAQQGQPLPHGQMGYPPHPQGAGQGPDDADQAEPARDRLPPHPPGE